MRHSTLLNGVFLALLSAASLSGQISLPAGSFLTSVTPGAALGISGNLGGLEFSADGLTLYVGGGAAGPFGVIYSVPVQRDPMTMTVTGFGPAAPFAPAPNIDGGLAFSPTGELFFTRYNNNALGQVVGGMVTSHPLPSATQSCGGLVFVPAGLPNAGDLLVSSYNNGDIFTIGLAPGPGGTMMPTTATLFAALPAGTEGLRFIPSGSQTGDLAVVNWNAGTVGTLDVDPVTGLPTSTALAPFVSGAPGLEGLAFDPLTTDFFMTTHSGSPSDSIIHVGSAPAPSILLTASATSISAATGGTTTLAIQGGVGNALRTYVVLGGTAGTSPGITLQSVHFPLNFDPFTDVVLDLINSIVFQDFVDDLDIAGNGTATLNAPPIPPVAIGITMHYAAAIFPPLTAASNPVAITIVN